MTVRTYTACHRLIAKEQLRASSNSIRSSTATSTNQPTTIQYKPMIIPQSHYLLVSDCILLLVGLIWIIAPPVLLSDLSHSSVRGEFELTLQVS